MIEAIYLALRAGLAQGVGAVFASSVALVLGGTAVVKLLSKARERQRS